MVRVTGQALAQRPRLGSCRSLSSSSLKNKRYLFDEFQTERDPGSRSVKVSNLYDVFSNIRDDEAEHVATMHAMQVRVTAVWQDRSRTKAMVRGGLPCMTLLLLTWTRRGRMC